MRGWLLHFTAHPKTGQQVLLARGSKFEYSPADIFLLKVNKRNIRTRCKTCSKLMLRLVLSSITVLTKKVLTT